MSWITALTLESETLIGHRFDFVRAYGILGITLDRENKFRLIKFTPFATACKEGGDSQVPHPSWGR